jgi:hypothetical protein
MGLTVNQWLGAFDPHTGSPKFTENNNMKPEVATQFFTNTDETGRFVYISSRTGRTYACKPVELSHVDMHWGFYRPSNRKPD